MAGDLAIGEESLVRALAAVVNMVLMGGVTLSAVVYLKMDFFFYFAELNE